MPKLTRNRRDVNAELRDVIAQGAPWVRRTEFVPMIDGSLRRRITHHGGTVEKDEVIDAARVLIAAARAGTGLSQAEFARLLGVSLRTLQDGGERAPQPQWGEKMVSGTNSLNLPAFRYAQRGGEETFKLSLTPFPASGENP